MSIPITLAGVRVIDGEIVMPARGLWTAELELDEPKALEIGQLVTLQVGDLTLEGAIHRGGPFLEGATYSVVAGRGGWTSVGKERHYRLDGGTRLSKVLTDLASDVAEEWTPGFGPGFVDHALRYAVVRRRRPAVRTLYHTLGAWYVGDDGRTVAGDRPTGRASADLLGYEAAQGLARIWTSTPSKLRPGQTLEIDGEPMTIGRVIVRTGKAGVEMHASVDHGPPVQTVTSPLLASIRAIVDELTADHELAGDVEYTVDAQSGAFASLKPVDKTMGYPSLQRVAFRGAPGVAGHLRAGTKVIVRFANSDMSDPYIAAVVGKHDGLFLPQTLEVDALSRVNVGASSDEVHLAGGAQGSAAVADLVRQCFADLALAINGAAVTAGDGGAALKTSILAALESAGWTPSGINPPSVASTKVRL